MAAAMVDFGLLSGFLGLPETTFNTALEVPSSELVQSILEAVSTKAQQFFEKENDNYRLGVELENAVHSSQTRIDGLKTSIESSQKMAEELRTQLNEKGMFTHSSPT